MDNELQHHGTKNQKWGVRRYQNKDGSLTPLGRLRYLKNKSRSKNNPDGNGDKKQNNKTNNTKESDEEREKVRINAEKERILKSRSAAELYKNAHLFTYEELNSAYNRLNLERNIANLIPQKVNRGKQFIDSADSWGKSVSSIVNTGSNLYNNVAKVYNSIPQLNQGRDPWPIINNNDKKK